MTVEMVRGTFTFSPAETSQLRIEEYIEQVEDGTFVFEFVYRNGKKEKWSVPSKYHTQPVNTIVKRIVTDYAAFAGRRNVIS
jgi:hypothetical protein